MNRFWTMILLVAGASLLISCKPNDTTPPFESPVPELLELHHFAVLMERGDTTEEWRIACDDTCIWEVTDEAGNVFLYTDERTYFFDQVADEWGESSAGNPYTGYFDFSPYENQFVYDEILEGYVAFDVTMGDSFDQVTLRFDEQHNIVDERTLDDGTQFTLTYIGGNLDFTIDVPVLCDGQYVVHDDACAYISPPFFNFVADEDKDTSDLDIVLSALKAYIEPYDQQQFIPLYESYESMYIDLDGIPPAEEHNHYLYREDVLNEPYFDAQFSPIVLLYDDLKYLTEVLDEPDIELGVPQDYEATYEVLDCCERFGHYYYETTADLTVVVMLAEGALYADVWRYDRRGDLADRSVFHITYDELGIVTVQSFRFEPDSVVGRGHNIYGYVDYHRADDGVMLRVIDDSNGINQMQMAVIDSNGTVHNYSFRKDGMEGDDLLAMTVVNPVEEYFFWSYFGENLDYRELMVYENGVFQVGHRRYHETDIDNYLGLNNFVVYNLGYVDGWDYYFDGFLYDTEGTQLTSQYNGFGVHIYPFTPELTQTLRFEIDGVLSQSAYENPLYEYSYDHIPYADFLVIWNQFDNRWDMFATGADFVRIGTIGIDLTAGGAQLILSTTSTGYDRFLDEIDELCDNCDTR